MQVSKIGIEIYQIYIKISLKSTGSTCDTCHLPSSKIHRCTRCLTKQYCGVECRDIDWSQVHKDVCRKEEVERKKKFGKEDRKEWGNFCFDASVKLMEALPK